jgi:hypothetical protein
MSKDKENLVVLQEYRDRLEARKREEQENKVVEDLGATIMDILREKNAEHAITEEDLEALKKGPASVLATEIVGALESLGLLPLPDTVVEDDADFIPEGTAAFPDGVVYDWGDAYISIDLTIVAELLIRVSLLENPS